jgi:hypothetical protein
MTRKGKGSIKSGCRTEGFLITLGGAQAHGYSGRDDVFLRVELQVSGKESPAKPDAMQAMLKMKKLDIAELERAAES